MAIGFDQDSHSEDRASQGSPNEVTVVADVSNPEDVLAASSFRRFIRTGRWIALFFAAGISIYGGVRLIYSENHFRPYLVFADDLSLRFESEQLGLDSNHRLSQVNETPVASLEEARMQFHIVENDELSLTFVSTDGSARDFWYRFLDPPFDFKVNSDKSIAFDESSDFIEELLGNNEVFVAVNGVPLDEIDPAVGPNPPRPASDIRRFERFTIRNLETGELRDLLIDVYPYARYWGRYFAGVGMLVIGLAVFWLRPNRKSAIGFVVFCFVAGTYTLFRAIPFIQRLPAENFVHLLAQCFVPATFVLFLLMFTPARVLVRAGNWWTIASIFVSIGLLGANAVWYPNLHDYGLLGEPLFQGWSYLVFGLLLLALPMDWWLWLTGRSLSPTDKQRSRALRLAMLMGFGPSAAFSLAVIPLARTWASDAVIYVDLALLLFPIILGYAIVKQNFLRLNDLALQGVTYGLLLAGVTFFYVMASSSLIPTLESYLPSTAPQARILLFAAAFGVLMPAHNITRRYLQSRFQIASFDYDAFLVGLGDDNKWQSPTEYCRSVAEQISRITRTPHVAVFTHKPGSPAWSLSAATPNLRVGLAPEECSSLFRLLARRQSEVFRDEVIEDVTLIQQRRELIDAFRALDAAVVMPLIMHGELVGAIAIGYKADETNYSTHEVHVLRRIGQHVARMLYAWRAQPALVHPRIIDLWPQLPERIGGYLIEQALGQGGMSYVFLGKRNESFVAIKVPNGHVQDNPHLMVRFQREVSVMQRICHENVVQIVEVGWHDREPFIVLEYFPEGSLDLWIKSQDAIPVAEAIGVTRQVATGLQAALVQGVVHRDIKPRNIFRTKEGIIKIADFGLAQVSDRSTLTMVGEVFGTPDYIAPEVLLGHSATPQSDQYSLGVTLFEMLTKTKPFSGDTVQSVMYQRIHAQAPDPRLRRGSLDSRIAAFAMRLLHKNPDKRFESYEVLISELDTLLEHYSKITMQ